MHFLRRTLKMIALAVALIAVFIGAYIGKAHYDQRRESEAKLHFLTKHEWKWANRYQGIQERYNPRLERTQLRKVNMTEQSVVYAYLDDNGRLNTSVVYSVKCKPNSVIITDQYFSDGKPKKLFCNPSGTRLALSIVWLYGTRDLTWNQNMGGFKVHENFSNWDFSRLDREITLKNAKVIKPNVFDQFDSKSPVMHKKVRHGRDLFASEPEK